MKEVFPGYCRKSDAEIKEIWDKGIIVFDTNVLLNLYRYSKSTKQIILDLIRKFRDKIWLPHQAALEYNRNRYEVISDQEKTYKEFIQKIIQIQKDLQSTSKPPFLSKSVHSKLNKVFEKVNSEVDESISKYSDYLKEDPIYIELTGLFENRITAEFTKEELAKIISDGEIRYKSKVPPGYEDEKKVDGHKKYGDLILWKQIIAKAKELDKPVILVTDERKTDWWWKIRDGRNMGPRHELVSEMKEEANVDFHMYSSERFLSYGQTFLEEQINQQAFKEIQAMKKAEMDHIRKEERRKQNNFRHNILTKEELDFLKHKYNRISKKIDSIDIEQQELIHESEDDERVQSYITNLGVLKSELEHEKMGIESKLNRYFEFEQAQNDGAFVRKRLKNYERFLKKIDKERE